MPQKRTLSTRRSAPAQGSGARPSIFVLYPGHKVRLKELAAFKKEHGHCDVPHIYPPNPQLASWVANVRSRHKTGSLDSELARRLDAMGFTWMLRNRTVYRHDWDGMIKGLEAFQRRHGHCRVPLRPGKYRELGTWLADVRRRKRKGMLARERVRQLDRMGFVWEPKAVHWEEMYAALVRYRAKYGDCNVPRGWPRNRRLAEWVRGQRRSREKNTLKQCYIDKLDAIGFPWTRAEAGDDLWELKYAELVEFQRVHGHCRVSTLSKEQASLGNWVRTQRGRRRKGQLTDEQIRRLDALGFLWEVPREVWMPTALVKQREARLARKRRMRHSA